MQSGSPTSNIADPWELQLEQFHALQRCCPDLLVLDCRTRGEYEAGHLDGATCFPLQEASVRIGELDARRASPVVVYCQSGRRSGVLVRYLGTRGFSNARSLAGGLEACDGDGRRSRPC